MLAQRAQLPYSVWLCLCAAMMPSRRRDMSGLRHLSDRPRRSRNPMRRGGMDAASKMVSGSDQVRASCSPAAPPPSGRRGRAGAGSQSAGRGRLDLGGAAEFTFAGFVRAGARGRGYIPRAIVCGISPRAIGPEGAPPRARHPLYSRLPSPVPKGPNPASRAPAAPPRPRAASAPISQTCARRRRRPPAPPTLCWARRFYAVERSQLVRRRR